jgi:hypothetical protein
MTDQSSTVQQSSPGHRLLTIVIVALLGGLLLATSMWHDAGAAPDGAATMLRQDTGATPIAGATPVQADTCEATSPGVGAEPWIRSELYFGTTMPDGSSITAEDWQQFLDEEITPRFPAGLTILEGYGQFLNAQGVIAAEASIVLIIFHPAEWVDESSAALEEIREVYEEQFDQESVLRADSEPVCISF